MAYVIGGAILGVFVAVVVVLAKKEGKKLEEMISHTTEEQRNKLALTEVNFVEGKNNEWIQDGMIAEMTTKGNKVALKILWHNKVMQNNDYDQITFGDTSVSLADAEKHGLQVGSFVKVKIAPESTIKCFEVIFE